MWPLRNNPFVRPVPSSSEGFAIPSVQAPDTLGDKTSARQARPPLKQVVKQLFLLSPAQWREDTPRATGAGSVPNLESYKAVLSSGASVCLTRQVSSASFEGELLKTTYELFINHDMVGNYFESNYVGGGRIIGGEFALCELFTHIAQGLNEDQSNSREWRAAKENHPLRHSKTSRV